LCREELFFAILARACGRYSAPKKNPSIFHTVHLGADFGDLKKFRTAVSEITEKISSGRLFWDGCVAETI
jgi:hypothetical protein